MRPLGFNGKNENVRRKRNVCGSKWVEFCRNTDLHGYKYIVMSGLSLQERCFWAISVLFCMATAAYLVIEAWHWFSRNPTVTVIESTHGAIWDVPFPAITICDLNLVSKRAALKFAGNLRLPKNFTKEEVFGYLRYIPLFASSYRISEPVIAGLTALQTVLDYNNFTIDYTVDALNPSPCSRLMQRCMWKNTIYRCEVLFRPILTHFTACCTFNYYAVDPPAQWHNDNDLFRPKTPRRVASCGYQSGLSVLINTDPEDYYSTPFASYGAVVLVDSAYNVPDQNSPLRLVNPQTEVFIALSPERTYATKGISLFSVKERGCLFKDEKNIGIMKSYSYQNCLIYKKSIAIAASCSCIPHNLPKNDSIRSCNIHDLKCLQTYEERVKNLRMTTAEFNVEFCLPECEHFSYPLEVAVGNLNRNSPLNGISFFKGVELKNHSLVNVFFNDLVSTRFRRDVYLNWQNLLASFGGLLGLLLGFTLISGVDFIIFIVFKLAFDGIMSRKPPKSSPHSNGFIRSMRKMSTPILLFNNKVGTFQPEKNVEKIKKTIFNKRPTYVDFIPR